ncbi:iron chaperone [Streptomyces sp. H27-D2]|uniref:iron chaperone n=1 Tax=Streptomyces sp. H27-D2 TaxID=3046304 RepID=UPI002DC02890|nr:DUF1801 domain-containing protein [Streptomyces sp. H27-D2]MEC4019445.1 DUF1801 domain-containing protein [Streptomyces sp. H27-D2]
MADHFATVDDYISSCPDDVQVILEQLRRTIRKAVPGVDETISYQMPTFTLNGRKVVHLAAWKHHIGIYPAPAPSADAAFERELAPYRAAEGTLRFPLQQPMPYDLIERLVVLLAEQRSAVHHRPGRPADRRTSPARSARGGIPGHR